MLFQLRRRVSLPVDGVHVENQQLQKLVHHRLVADHKVDDIGVREQGHAFPSVKRQFLELLQRRHVDVLSQHHEARAQATEGD